MSVTPRISLVAFEDRNPHFIFVAVPDERGRYLRTDRSVALVACPQCQAIAGQPCRSAGGDGYSALTHHRRRSAAHWAWGARTDDVLHKPVMPPPTPDEWMEASA